MSKDPVGWCGVREPRDILFSGKDGRDRRPTASLTGVNRCGSGGMMSCPVMLCTGTRYLPAVACIFELTEKFSTRKGEFEGNERTAAQTGATLLNSHLVCST